MISIRLPALRERPEDIPILAEHFLGGSPSAMGRPMRDDLAPRPCELLLAYRWPGNVRELENVIERGVALESRPSSRRQPAAAPAGAPGAAAATRRSSAASRTPGSTWRTHLQQIERMHLERALKQAGGVQVQAAELLGITFRQFRYLAKKYQLKWSCRFLSPPTAS